MIEIVVEAAQPNGAAVGTLPDGRRVLVPPFDPCGECDVCRRGGAAVCPQLVRRTPAARINANERWLVPLAGELDIPGAEAAAIAGDVATAYTLYARSNVAPRDPVVITGATPVARFLDQILRAKGITPIHAVPGADI